MLGHDRAAEEVLDPDATNAVGIDGAVEQVGDRGNRAHLQVQLERRLDDAPNGADPGSWAW